MDMELEGRKVIVGSKEGMFSEFQRTEKLEIPYLQSPKYLRPFSIGQRSTIRSSFLSPLVVITDF